MKAFESEKTLEEIEAKRNGLDEYDREKYDCKLFKECQDRLHDLHMDMQSVSECKKSLKVSKLEFDILLYLYNNTKFRYIARDEGGYLFAYYYPVVKGTENWEGGENYETLDIFVTLFKFVKWEDENPTSIKEVLENCEVIEDDL